MNFKSILGIIGVATWLMSCSDSQPQGPILGDVSKGKEIFETNCAVCHQQDGKGKTGFAPSINNIDFLGVANDHLIKRFILEGRSGTSMFPFKNNPNVADNIDDVVAFMRSWSEDYSLYKDIPVNHDWESSGDATNGEALFANYCAACHGAEGQGYSAGGSGTGIANASFVSLVPDDYIKQTLLLGRAGTAMKPFDGSKGVASLSNSEMDDIVSFIRTKAEFVQLASVDGGSTGASSETVSAADSSLFYSPLFITFAAIMVVCIMILVYLLTILIRLKKILVASKK
ncbi:MAG: c-type cytochrome [Reichenbachiella sp.]